jgi:hypothetical protein
LETIRLSFLESVAGMQIPNYWAVTTLDHTHPDGRVLTIRRYGWSDDSEAAARARAEQRAQQALQRLLAGDEVLRREGRLGYNGIDGTPIREEVIERRGELVLTRNSYGALCLNTPDVLFVDIDDADFERPVLGNASVWVAGILLALLVGVFVNLQHSPHGWLLAALILMLTSWVGLRKGREGEALGAQRKQRALARLRTRMDEFLQRHPDWLVRLYQTPAGLRLLVMHRLFEPAEPEVQACFAAFEADPIYVRMCLSQQCFRARVSPKPWRLGWRRGLSGALSHWPPEPAAMPQRARWVQGYERKAQDYAACQFIEEFGQGHCHPQAAALRDWHDQLCRANDARLPLA